MNFIFCCKWRKIQISSVFKDTVVAALRVGVVDRTCESGGPLGCSEQVKCFLFFKFNSKIFHFVVLQIPTPPQMSFQPLTWQIPSHLKNSPTWTTHGRAARPLHPGPARLASWATASMKTSFPSTAPSWPLWWWGWWLTSSSRGQLKMEHIWLLIYSKQEEQKDFPKPLWLICHQKNKIKYFNAFKNTPSWDLKGKTTTFNATKTH